MVNEKIRKSLGDLGEEFIVFDNPSFDNSIIGISTDDHVVYLLSKMVEELMVDDEIDYEEALDFICYNTLRSVSYVEGNTPIVVDDLTFIEGVNDE